MSEEEDISINSPPPPPAFNVAAVVASAEGGGGGEIPASLLPTSPSASSAASSYRPPSRLPPPSDRLEGGGGGEDSVDDEERGEIEEDDDFEVERKRERKNTNNNNSERSTGSGEGVRMDDMMSNDRYYSAMRGEEDGDEIERCCFCFPLTVSSSDDSKQSLVKQEEKKRKNKKNVNNNDSIVACAACSSKSSSPSKSPLLHSEKCSVRLLSEAEEGNVMKYDDDEEDDDGVSSNSEDNNNNKNALSRCWGRTSKRKKICLFSTAVVFVVFVVVAVCLYQFVAPKIISEMANKAEYHFLNVTMTNPQGLDRVYLFCQASVLINSPIAATTEATIASFMYNGTEIGEFTFDPISFAKGNNSVVFTQQGFLTVKNLKGFQDMARTMMFESESSWNLVMSVTVWAEIPHLFSIPFHNIYLDVAVHIPGFGGWDNAKLIGYDLEEAQNGEGIGFVEMAVNDASIVSVDIGDIVMGVFIEGEEEAIMTFHNVSFKPGDNNLLIGRGPVTPRNQTILDDMFYRYLNGYNITINSVGVSCSTPLYDGIFKGLSLSYQLPGNNPYVTPIVVAALMEINLKMVLDGLLKGQLDIPAQLYLQYEFSAPISFTGFELDVYHDGNLLGGYHGPVSPAITVPGHSRYLTRLVPIEAYMHLTNIGTYLRIFVSELEKGMTYLVVKGKLKFQVANIVASAYTEQPPVPTCMDASKALCGIP